VQTLQRIRGHPTLAPDDVPGLDGLSDERFVEIAYWAVLLRGPDPLGREDNLARLRDGMSRAAVLRRLAQSPEFVSIPIGDGLASLHQSRMMFVRSLPPARRILDLGGVALNSDDGALVVLGYPYPFDELIVVDLPPEDRHELYQGGRVDRTVDTVLGPVSYRYHSMADLSGIADASVDLVYSGQTFEHVSPPDGEQVLAEVRRVLRPGGHLALDTPNRAVTAIQLDHDPARFIDPDHEVEYTHGEMVRMFERHGFAMQRAHGLNLCPSIDVGRYDPVEMAAHPGLFDDVERCYLLAYVVTRPSAS
jgi:SAM-dependent methyltransferase